MSNKQYATPTAFRMALENRLKNYSIEHGVDLQEVRRQVAFERFLCRFFSSELRPPVLLKGGYAMELRTNLARSTRDIDLTLNRAALDQRLRQYESDSIVTLLKQHAKKDLGDYFIFLVGAVMQQLDTAPYGGERYSITANLDRRPFVKFHIDISLGDSNLDTYELLNGKDWLSFASIKTEVFAAISREQQFSEKLHAYTMPRGNRVNSRFRDLIDMVLLIDQGELDPGKLRQCIRSVFSFRAGHMLPSFLESPPENWKEPLEEMAPSCGLEPDMGKLFDRVQSFVGPLLKKE